MMGAPNQLMEILEQTPRPLTESQFNVVISEDGQTRSLYASGHASSVNIELKKQPRSPKIVKQAVPLTNSNSKYGESKYDKTTILINQQSAPHPPESGPASSAASSPLHDVLSQTESPLESPRMPAFAPAQPVAQQCAQVQTEAPPHLEGSSSLSQTDSYVHVLSAAQIKEFIDTFRAITLSSL